MPSSLAPGAIVAERYRISGVLGEGSFGVVLRVERLEDGRALAMKVLKDEAGIAEQRARLRREATALATLAHPNVVGVIELGEHEGALFLVTELLEGRPLDAALDELLAAPLRALAVVDQVLGGLAFAHAMGVAHRDLKPGNVFLTGPTDAPKVKLLDFGLAKFAEPAAFGHATALTAAGTIMGTPDYMAPEQIFGRPVDVRADVYAAGVLLFEVMTGRVPFVRDDVTSLFQAHAAERPPTLAATGPGRSFPPELEAVVARALEKRPEDRFADARAMRTALSRVPRGGFS